MAQIIWNGTESEAARFIAALAKHCSCDQNKKTICPSHYAMAHDQRFCDGLLYYYHLHEKLELEEFKEE